MDVASNYAATSPKIVENCVHDATCSVWTKEKRVEVLSESSR